MPRVPVTDSHLEDYNVKELKEFLRARNRRVTGKKNELLSFAKLYKDDPIVEVSSLPDIADIDMGSLIWSGIVRETRATLPKGFTIDTIK